MKAIIGDGFPIEKPLECLRCNAVLNMAAQVGDDGSRPEPGAVMLCFGCGYVMMLDKDSEPRAPSRRELREIQQEATVVTALMSFCAFQGQEILKLKKENEAYAKRTSTVPGGSPPGDQGHGGAEGLPPRVSGADGVG